ncbi:MAG TPA: type II secretion system F family protein [Burkholderiales bacterium]|nr:type II secretion system F family protein [Burkholderiales bacterium]
MTLYAYRAVDQHGEVKKGVLDALSESDLEERLTRVGMELISGRPALKKSLTFGSRVGRRDLITFFFNLEMLTRAGVPLIESLTDLRDATDVPYFREVVTEMIENIEGGMRFSQAVSLYPGIFDSVMVNLIRAGEESARLPAIFKHLTDSLKWHDEMSAQTKQILLYPAFVGTVVVAITFFLMTNLVPQLSVFFKNLGQTLPPQTRALISVSNFFVHYKYALLATPVCLYILLKLIGMLSRQARYWRDSLKIRIWIIGPILLKIILARFANTFAIMYESGVSVLDCIAISSGITGNLAISGKLQQARIEIEAGKTLLQGFQESGIFPALVIRMIKVGEATGRLDEALFNVSYFYERDTREAIRRVQVMIEPVLTVILGAMLGWIMLSAITPIYDMLGKIR